MKPYTSMTREELAAELEAMRASYDEFAARGLKLDVTRGKPSPAQLDLAMELCGEGVPNPVDGGVDTRNYGGLEGLASARRLFADLMGHRMEQVMVTGSASLELMYACMVRSFCFGTYEGAQPWCRQEKIKWLCPAPGYDRHFRLCELFGMEQIPVEMKADGPDMDAVEALVKSDAAIKGIWCVPMFSNPTGAVYSDEVIERMAKLRPAAPDFRIYWDNAYAVHCFRPPLPRQANLLERLAANGNPDMAFEFTSTSKITFAGAGLAVLASSENNINYIRKLMAMQAIGPDKVNQLRHVNFLRDKQGVIAHMERHAAILAPKFAVVARILARDLAGLGVAEWNDPSGGYFVSLDVMDGCAARVVELAGKAGVAFTPAGATFPLGRDPRDRNLRIAPSFPPVEELDVALSLLTVCVRLAALERLLEA